MFKKIATNNTNGFRWVGLDGLANMESAALLVIFLMIFLQWYLAVPISFVAVMAKCLFDKSRGSQKERHDMICASIGVIIGFLLATAMVM